MPNQRRRVRLAPKALTAKAIALAVASCFSASVSTTVLGNPTAPSVVSGSAIFSRQGNLLAVTNSPGAIIHWQGFSIAASEITRFIQQSSASSVLNRVVGVDPSIILGALQSNGRVFLINPNGILFGQNSRVDVAGLVASTLNISDRDFLAGKLKFTDTPGASSVVNQGAITTPSGGQVYLIAPNVQNTGIITSPQGEIILAAGRSVELVDAATPNLRVEISAPDTEAVNVGQIIANSGKVGIYGGLIRNRGEIRADGVVMGSNGEILLKATQNATLDAGSIVSASGAQGGKVTVQSGDTTLVAGTLDAIGGEGKGGTVQVLGNRVGLVGNASINASGATGGGTVLVGGDYQGGNPEIENAFRTYVGPEAKIRADAVTTGDGGKVVVWSEDATGFYGAISARGGAQSGNGGFAEVSGKNYLDYRGLTNVSASHGTSGTLLLDPNNVIINDAGPTQGSFDGEQFFLSPFAGPNNTISWGTIQNQLDPGGANSNATITTSGSQCAAAPPLVCGDITIATNSPSLATANRLRLLAHRDIVVNGTVTNSATGNIEAFAGWDGASISTPIVTAGVGTINVNQNVSTLGGIRLIAGDDINIGSAAATATSFVISGGLMTVTAGDALTVRGGSGANAAAILNSSGGQSISANNIFVVGGTAAGGGASAQIHQTGAGTNQVISLNNVLTVQGGSGGANNFATIRNDGVVQSVDFTLAGVLNVTGGSGTNGNSAQIQNNGAAQTITFNAGGAINVTGGTNGVNNNAGIFAAGNQTISGNPNITLGGGASGASNRAQIALAAGSGVQTINAHDISLTGGVGGTLNAATINTNVTGMTAIITATGSVSLAGNAGTDSSAAIGSNSGDYNLTLDSTGPVTLTGGSGGFAGFGAVATIGATGGFNANVTVNSNAAVTLTSGTGPGAAAAIGSNTGGGTINVSAGVGGSSNLTLTGNATNPAAILTTGNITLGASNNVNLQDAIVSANGSMNVTATNNLNVIAGTASTRMQSAGLQTISANGITVQAAPAGTNLRAEITSNGGQTITAGANGITLTGGAGGSGNNANINQLGLSNDQLITVNSGGIVSVTGGGGTASQAEILNFGNAQSLTFTAGGALNLTGGIGAGGSNEGVIQNSGAGATTQTIAFTGGGAINITGGTNGSNNEAGIFAAGNQTINGSPDITLLGGASGGLVGDNGAYILLETGSGVQTINAHNISLTGGAGGNSNGAAISTNVTGMTSNITATGSVTLTGGAGTDAFAAIGSDISDFNLTLNSTGPVTLTGGSGPFAGFGAVAVIGAFSGFNANVILNSNAAVTLTSGTGPRASAAIGSDTGGGNINVSAGVGGGSNLALTGNATNPAAILTTGNITLGASNDVNLQNAIVSVNGSMNVTATNNLNVIATTASTRMQSAGLQTISAKGITVQAAPAGTNLRAEIVSSGGQTITAGANGITLIGGAGGSGNKANINQNGLSNDQLITVNSGGIVSMTGGGGTASQAEILNFGNAQSLTFTAGGTLNLTGGAGAGGNNEAEVKNIGAGATTQTIAFTGGGAINMTGGTNGINNDAGIFAAGNQTISGNPDMTLLGGASGGAPTTENGAFISLEHRSGVQTINAHNISLTGGAGGNSNGAAISTDVTGMTSNITATGSVTLTGGAGTDAFAAMGSDSGDFNLTLNSTGPVTLTGGSGACATFCAMALIGALDGFNANVTINSNAAVTLTSGTGPGASAAIGSDTGGGNINISAGVGGSSNLALTGNANNPASILTTGNITLRATNDINVGGALASASSIVSSGGPMTVTAGSTLTLQAGSGTNADALLTSGGGQTISAANIGLIGGAAAGGSSSAEIRQTGAGATQTINLTGAGTLSLQGGSGGAGNFARIRNDGVSQSINFAGPGVMTLSGGTGTSNNFARVQALIGTQAITGSPAIALTGGASGGVDGNGNIAQIIANVGSQTITAANTAILAGAGGVDNSATILAPNQNLTVNGSLVLTGGGDSPGLIPGGGGARIGGLGGATPTPTDLTLTINGSATLTGGTGTGVAIGSNVEGGQPTDMTINVTDNLTLTPGSGTAGARIGSPSSSVAGGGISIAANNIRLNGPGLGGAGTAIRTAGDITLQAPGDATIGGIVSASQDIIVNLGGNLSVLGGAGFPAEITNAGGAGLMDITVGGNIVVTGGSGGGFAQIHGNPDVNLTLTGATSEIRLNATTSSAYARIWGQSPATITVSFPARPDGGHLVNGHPVVADAATLSGFYVGIPGSEVEAVLGSNLRVEYGIAELPPTVVTAVVKELNSITGEINNSTDFLLEQEQTASVTEDAPESLQQKKKNEEKNINVCN